MRHGFWFNVRLMNCEIFIFTSSLSFWELFRSFLWWGRGEGEGEGGDGLSRLF